MFGIPFLTPGRLIGGIIVIALLAWGSYKLSQIYDNGFEAGKAVASAQWANEKLDLQNKLLVKQQDEAKQINERLDQVLIASQTAVTTIDAYVKAGIDNNRNVLATVRGKQLYVTGDCNKVNAEFQRAWDAISKGAKP